MYFYFIERGTLLVLPIIILILFIIFFVPIMGFLGMLLVSVLGVGISFYDYFTQHWYYIPIALLILITIFYLGIHLFSNFNLSKRPKNILFLPFYFFLYAVYMILYLIGCLIEGNRHTSFTDKLQKTFFTDKKTKRVRKNPNKEQIALPSIGSRYKRTSKNKKKLSR